MSSLCQLASDYRGQMPDDGLAFEQKVDGWRAMAFRGHGGQLRLWSRNGHRIEGAGHIIHRLQIIEEAAGEPLFIDGEFLVGGNLADTKRWCEQGWKMGGEAGRFYAFDIAPLSEWQRGGWDQPWHERKAWLTKLVQAVDEHLASQWDWREGSRGRDDGPSPVIVLEDGWCFTPADVASEARRMWARGAEGLMLKAPLAPYRRNRCDAWLKVKQDNQHKWMRKAA